MTRRGRLRHGGDDRGDQRGETSREKKSKLLFCESSIHGEVLNNVFGTQKACDPVTFVRSSFMVFNR